MTAAQPAMSLLDLSAGLGGVIRGWFPNCSTSQSPGICK
jgi:hypothetical protein